MKNNLVRKIFLGSLLISMMILSGCTDTWTRNDTEADKKKQMRDAKWKQEPRRSLLEKPRPDNTWETRRKTQQNYGNQTKTGRVIGVTNQQ